MYFTNLSHFIMEEGMHRIGVVAKVAVQAQFKKLVQLVSVVTCIIPAKATRFGLECVGMNLQTITFHLKKKFEK